MAPGATERSPTSASSTSPCSRTSSPRGRWRGATACTAKATGSASERCSSSTVTESFGGATRSEEHTSELQSRLHLVCRLLLEKKKKKTGYNLLSGSRTKK